MYAYRDSPYRYYQQCATPDVFQNTTLISFVAMVCKICYNILMGAQIKICAKKTECQSAVRYLENFITAVRYGRLH